MHSLNPSTAQSRIAAWLKFSFKWGKFSLLLLLLASCSAFNRPNVAATLRAESANYRQEMTALASTVTAQATAASAQVYATSTALALAENINDQLMATARAVLPRTPIPVYASSVPPDAALMAGTVTQFMQTATAASVRADDGCADMLQSAFNSNTPRIYIVTRAFNITGGTQMSAEWSLNGQVLTTDSFTVGADDADICLWFYIDPQTTPFNPGTWQVQLAANGTRIEPAVTFSITG